MSTGDADQALRPLVEYLATAVAERVEELISDFMERPPFEAPPLINEVAARLGTSRRTVLRLIDEGVLETVASDIGGRRVTIASLERYAHGQSPRAQTPRAS